MSLDNLRSTSQSAGNCSASTQPKASSVLEFRTRVTKGSCTFLFPVIRQTMSWAAGKIESSIVTAIPGVLHNDSINTSFHPSNDFVHISFRS